MTDPNGPVFIRLKAIQLLLLLTLLVASTSALRAQPAAVQQLQNTRLTQQPMIFQSLSPGTNAPELYRGESTDVGPQRILRLIPRHRYFNVLLDSQVFYSDNANFAQSSEKIGSTVFVNTFQAAFSPPSAALANGRISATLGLASQWYNYESDRMTGLDFDAQTVFFGSKYVSGKWVLAFDASYTRLVNQPDYYLTYQEFLPALTLQRFVPLNDTMLIAIGNQVDYHFTDEHATLGTDDEINNRFDDIFSLTFSWQLTQQLVLQPSYRFIYTNYRYNTLQDSDRNDYLNSFGLSLAFYFNETVSLRTFFNYNIKDSDDPYSPDYHEHNEGVGATVNFTF
jgi:hypothetical protein